MSCNNALSLNLQLPKCCIDCKTRHSLSLVHRVWPKFLLISAKIEAQDPMLVLLEVSCHWAGTRTSTHLPQIWAENWLLAIGMRVIEKIPPPPEALAQVTYLSLRRGQNNRGPSCFHQSRKQWGTSHITLIVRGAEPWRKAQLWYRQRRTA